MGSSERGEVDAPSTPSGKAEKKQNHSPIIPPWKFLKPTKGKEYSEDPTHGFVCVSRRVAHAESSAITGDERAARRYGVGPQVMPAHTAGNPPLCATGLASGPAPYRRGEPSPVIAELVHYNTGPPTRNVGLRNRGSFFADT